MQHTEIFARPAVRSAVAASILALSACGLTYVDQEIAEDRQEELQGIAEKTSRLSDLEREAYARNTLLNFSAAEQDYRETLRLARDLFPTDPARASNLRLHLALNKSNLGQYESAESLFERSRDIVAQIGPLSDRAKPDLFYSQHQMNLKQYASAEEIARRALATLDALIPTADQVVRSSLDGMGFARRDDGILLVDESRANVANTRNESDVRVDQGIRRLTERQRLQLQRVQALYIVARALRAQGKSDAEVADLIDRADAGLQAVPEVFGRWLRAEIASLRADRLKSQGRVDQAIAELDAAIEILRKYEFDTRPEALLLFKKGEFLIEAGRDDEGQVAYRRGLDIIRDDEQGIEVEQASTVIDRMLEDVQADDRDAQNQLFVLMQKIRSSATAQTVAQLSARLSGGDDRRAEAIRRLQDLERELNVVAARFDRLEGDPNADVHYKRVTAARLGELRSNLSQQRKLLEEVAPNYDQMIEAAIPLDDAQAALEDGEVMVVIQLGPEKGLVAAITNLVFEAYEITLDTAAAEEAVRELRTPIDGEFLLAFDVDRSHEIYRTLFGPVSSTIEDASHLIVVPSGPLLSLPFNVLVAEPYEEEVEIVGTDPYSAYFDYSRVKWLGGQVPITTGVSIASFFLGRQAPASDAAEPFRGFGDFKRFGEDPEVIVRISSERELPESCGVSVRALGLLNELGGTRGELEKVQQVIGVPDEDIILGQEFTDAAVINMDLSRFRVLHFATHGLLAQDPECLPEPGLVTSVGARGDGLLEASEIVDLDLDAELVVMSACDTGAGAGRAAEELIGFRGVGGSYAAGGESLNGLARSFFFAGARNVMSTHWSVDDRATQELMTGFYSAVEDGEEPTIAEALLATQKALIDGGELSHPFFWAPFAIIGDGARELRLAAGGEASQEAGEDEISPEPPTAEGA